MYQVAQKIDVLQVNGLIKSIAPFRRSTNLGVASGALTEHGFDRITWHRVSKRERPHADQEEDQERLNKASTDVGPDAQCQRPQARKAGRIGMDDRQGGQSIT